MVTEVSTKAPCKEPGNECEGDDDEHEEEDDADDPGPRLGKVKKILHYYSKYYRYEYIEKLASPTSHL